MYSKVFEIVQTKEDLNLVLDEIMLLKNTLFKTEEGSFESALDNEISKSLSDLIKSEIAENKISPKEYLNGLEKALENLEEIKIQVAFEPSVRSLTAITEWVTNNIGHSVILDLYYNPAIIGGASISYKGKYYDGSLSKKIENKNA